MKQMVSKIVRRIIEDCSDVVPLVSLKGRKNRPPKVGGGPQRSPRQGDLAQIPGSEQAYELVHIFFALMITLVKF